ncbi:hypothetical protein BJ742DRAFT_657330, partial [Cladochytrium replicatum]
MSFDINWKLLDEGHARSLKDWLNEKFASIECPSFIRNIKITELDFGDVPPDVVVNDLVDPLPDFYMLDDQTSDNQSTAPYEGSDEVMSPHGQFYNEDPAAHNLLLHRNWIDMEPLRSAGGSDNASAVEPPQDASVNRDYHCQVELLVEYKGNFRLTITVEFLVNQPTPAFLVLPVTLTLTGFSFQASAIVAYLGNRINFCLVPADGSEHLIKDISIESEIGDTGKQVLKNVSKIEKFIVEELRKLVDDYCVYPNF